VPDAAITSELHPLPGLDVVGRGLYLRPHRPYELKRSLFEQRSFRRFHSREADSDYRVPAGYEVDESPPPPTGMALNRVTIEESWERFNRARSLDSSVAGGWLVFNVDVSAHLGVELRGEVDSYYGVRSSFVALWSVYLEDPSAPSVELDVARLPVPFAPAERRTYDQFFERYGTHFVKRAWVGGKAEVMVRVAKTSAMSKEQIGAGLQASVGLPGLLPSNRVRRELQRSREALVSRSQTMVVGRGGDEHRLAALSSLDAAAYDEWLGTIRNNPQTVELELAGIWNLVADPAVAQALIDAYRAAATFTPLTSLFELDERVYLIRGHDVFSYDRRARTTTRPRPIVAHWPALAGLGFDRIDAALAGRELDPALAAKVYLFRADELVRVDAPTGAIDEGYPRKVSAEWPGVGFDKIDAAVVVGPSLYLFAAELYARVDLDGGRVDAGYPALVAQRWAGLSFDRIDAALRGSDGKLYFFRNDQYIRYDPVTLRADPEYPKAIVGSYVEDWTLFE